MQKLRLGKKDVEPVAEGIKPTGMMARNETLNSNKHAIK